MHQPSILLDGWPRFRDSLTDNPRTIAARAGDTLPRLNALRIAAMELNIRRAFKAQTRVEVFRPVHKDRSRFRGRRNDDSHGLAGSDF